MRRSVIGMDIGSNSVKLAQVVAHDGTARLERLVLVAPELKDIAKAVDYRNSTIVLVVNSPRTTAKRVVMPSMPKEELRNAVNLEAKAYFPFSIDDAAIDFEVVGSVLESGMKKSEVLVSTCPDSTVKEALGLCDKLNLKPSQIIHNSIALKNLLGHGHGGVDGRPIAFLDIGACFSELVIFKDKKISLVRKLPVAGRSFTESMTSILLSDSGKTELSINEAEKIKQKTGLPEDCASKETIDNKISCSQLFSMLRPIAEKLSTEIERSFDYYREESSGQKVERMVLFGGGGLLKGLDKFLREALGIDVEIAIFTTLMSF